MKEKLESFVGILLVTMYVFAIISFVFDFGTTYYMLNQDKHTFMETEQNSSIVEHIQKGKNFWTEEIIWIQGLILLSSIFIFRKINNLNFDERFKYLINVAVASSYMIFTVFHVDGGLSWL